MKGKRMSEGFRATINPAPSDELSEGLSLMTSGSIFIRNGDYITSISFAYGDLLHFRDKINDLLGMMK